MPPACTPEKHFDAQQNVSEEESCPLLGYVTPPRNVYNENTKQSEREDRLVQWVSQKLPVLSTIFNIHKKIGEGTFSAVFMATLHADDEKKIFAIKHLVPTTHPKRIEVELQCLKQIGGKENVAGLNLCLRENDNIVFVMPYLQHTHFLDYVSDMQTEEVALYIKNLLIAVSRVHSFGIIHRDIKPNNFLYDRKNQKFLLIDFGLAQLCSTNSQNENESQTNKRKRECEESPSIINTNEETIFEPANKRPALQSKNLYNLSSTISHLQKCSTDLINITRNVSKENMPSTELSVFNKIPTNNISHPLKKSPFKVPGLDFSTPDPKMAMRIKGQRQLFQNDVANNLNQQSPVVNKIVTADIHISKPANNQVNDAKQKQSKPLQICKCYGKACICNICLVRKCLEAPRAGTPGFRPPEVLLKYAKQTTAVDMWAVGVIMLCILSGTYPFFRAPNDITALAEMITIFGDERMKKLAKTFDRQLICSEQRPALDLRKICCKLRSRSNNNPSRENVKCSKCTYLVHNCVCIGTPMDGIVDSFPDSAYDLLNRLLDVNPSTRITAEEALKHPFLNN